MASNHAAPILHVEGQATLLPTTLDSLVHVMVTRTDRPSLKVPACGARGPVSRTVERGKRFRIIDEKGEWILGHCKRCDHVIDAYFAMLRRERMRQDEAIR